ncbi:MAG: 23S rRNA (adenine(2503)-C(2))-methyltransferase RlmN [Anaerolineae bacterium]
MIRLLDLTLEQLRTQVQAWGEPVFRADQLWHWLYARQANDPAAMSNLPRTLQARIATDATIEPLKPVAQTASADLLAHKVLFQLRDGQTVEAVLMLYDRRRTLCISTQAGCAMGCTFCATGLAGLARNLTAGEIAAQVLYFARWLGDPEAGGTNSLPIMRPAQVTNVVLMGMGEPLANYRAVWQALHTLTDAQGFGLGARHFTLSTVGLAPMIERMAGESLQVNLAVSLHAPSDELRNRLVPINRRYPLAVLLAACRAYTERTHRRLSFEYALMRGINDRQEHAQRLALITKGMLCHVNLIPLNPVRGSAYQPSTKADTEAFLDTLQQAGISSTLRLRRGVDINAGCGQLRQQVQSRDGAG